jgi:ABC-type enterobactin transport system permease subunit
MRFVNRRIQRRTTMRLSVRLSGFRVALMALTVAFATFGLAPAADADGGSISFTVLKGGWVIGASGGNGTLVFHGRRYPISIGGLSAGIIFGASETFFQGSVSNIRSPYDVAGVYGAAGAGAAVGAGAQFITLTNEKGAILTLTGRQVGLQINADLSGLSISVR